MFRSTNKYPSNVQIKCFWRSNQKFNMFLAFLLMNLILFCYRLASQYGNKQINNTLKLDFSRFEKIEEINKFENGRN